MQTTDSYCLRGRRRHVVSGWQCCLILAATCATARSDDAGGQLYQQKCASCHGAAGEGVPDKRAEPLTGERSVAELAKYIDENMPEDDPDAVDAAGAAAVAAYIHEAFYSPLAQARIRPARIELARLTVRQYQNAVADLFADADAPRAWSEERGLKGRYSKSGGRRRRGRDGDDASFERIDATVNFDFGESSPDPEKIPVEQFSVRWEGSVLAPDTGEYEFVLESKNGARLWVNDLDEPLIDGSVRSGEESLLRESIRLIGGRAYALRLEFFKSEKAKEKTAAIRLKWKPPHQTEDLIPERSLSPQRAPAWTVVETPFPPDDRSIGYERGTSISKEWNEATTLAAIEVAGKVVADLEDLADVRDDESDRDARLRQFCGEIVERAFRRPLSDAERQLYVDSRFDGAPDPETAVKRVVLLVLKSPRFLYREIAADGLDQYDVASWLAFTLWDSLPDRELLDAAAKGELQTREQVAAQAERMLADVRARSKVREFLHQWLRVDRIRDDISKDAELFPGFNAAIAADLRTSLDLFLDDVLWREASDFRQLLFEDHVYLNGRLAQFYGVELPADTPFQKVALNADARAGVLSHPFLMTGFAYNATSSPIHRGVFLARGLLGRMLKPPQEAVTPDPPELHPDLTTRERIDLQTSAVTCQSCHSMINPLGFSLEHFDAVGRYRSEEKGKAIDAAGFYLTRSGETATFAGARGLAGFLAGSEEAQDAFIEQLFHYMVKQPVRAFGPDRQATLRRSFTENGFSVRRLLVDLTATSALTARDLANGAATRAESLSAASP